MKVYNKYNEDRYIICRVYGVTYYLIPHYLAVKA